MGEAKRRGKAVLTQALQAMVVDTPGGRIHVNGVGMSWGKGKWRIRGRRWWPRLETGTPGRLPSKLYIYFSGRFGG